MSQAATTHIVSPAAGPAAAPAAAAMDSPRILPDTFPAKTYLLIETCDRDDPDVARWIDDGTAFVVKDTAQLAIRHLPKYFKHSNFQSFVRQLNIYGFRKDPARPGPAAGGADTSSSTRNVVFRHENFLRGRQDLLKTIQRSNKGRFGGVTTGKSTGKPSGKPTVCRTSTGHKHGQRKQLALSSTKEESKEAEPDQPSLRTLQMQMDVLSRKLDLVLSLLTHQDEVGGLDAIDITASKYPPVPTPAVDLIGPNKRRRHDEGGHGASKGYVSAGSDAEDSQIDLCQNRGARKEAYSRMKVVEEEEKTRDYEPMQEYRGSYRGTTSGNFNGDEFTEFIETMLENEDAVMNDDNLMPSKELNQSSQDMNDSALDLQHNEQFQSGNNQFKEGVARASRGGTEERETVLRSDAAAIKVAPQPVEGVQEQNDATVDAVITSAERVDAHDVDLENGTPVAQPIEVAGSVWTVREILHHHPVRGLRLVIVILVMLVLIAFIVWPSVVFASRKDDERIPTRTRPPPPPRPPVRENVDEVRSRVQGRMFTPPPPQSQNDSSSNPIFSIAKGEPDPAGILDMTWEGMAFKCRRE